VEIEMVPHSITQAIVEKTGLFLISMGAGAAGNAPYLFSDDVLGQNRGHVPRDVHETDYPAPQYLVDSENEVVEAFRDWLDHVA